MNAQSRGGGAEGWAQRPLQMSSQRRLARGSRTRPSPHLLCPLVGTQQSLHSTVHTAQGHTRNHKLVPSVLPVMRDMLVAPGTPRDLPAGLFVASPSPHGQEETLNCKHPAVMGKGGR